MWFKITGSVQCKNQRQAGSPEVRFFSTSCRLQQLFQHLTSPLGSAKLSDPHAAGDAGERERDARSAVDTDTDFQPAQNQAAKTGCKHPGLRVPKAAADFKKYGSSSQSQQPFYLLDTVTNPGLPPSSSASVWPLFYVSKAGIFCLTVLKN